MKKSTSSKRHQEFITSSGINSSFSEDCLTRDDDGCDQDVPNSGARSYHHSGNSRTKNATTNRTERIGLLLDLYPGTNRIVATEKFNQKRFVNNRKKYRKQRSGSKAESNRFMQELDLFIETSIMKQRELCQLIRSGSSPTEQLLEHIGLEQQIVGGICFYKSYRLVMIYLNVN